MKISTKGRYGLRAILDMILHSNGENVSLISIAERQNISKNYLEQVFSALRKAGIVKSIKGAQGGYILADKPANVSVGEILRILEGDLSVANIDPDMNGNKIEICIKKFVWDEIDQKVNHVVDSVSLEDLMNEYHNEGDNLMYYI